MDIRTFLILGIDHIQSKKGYRGSTQSQRGLGIDNVPRRSGEAAGTSEIINFFRTMIGATLISIALIRFSA